MGHSYRFSFIYMRKNSGKIKKIFLKTLANKAFRRGYKDYIKIP